MWLERELTDAEGRGDRVLVFSHDLIHPEQVSPQCRLACLSWNFDAVLKAREPPSRPLELRMPVLLGLCVSAERCKRLVGCGCCERSSPSP